MPHSYRCRFAIPSSGNDGIPVICRFLAATRRQRRWAMHHRFSRRRATRASSGKDQSQNTKLALHLADSSKVQVATVRKPKSNPKEILALLFSAGARSWYATMHCLHWCLRANTKLESFTAELLLKTVRRRFLCGKMILRTCRQRIMMVVHCRRKVTIQSVIAFGAYVALLSQNRHMNNFINTKSCCCRSKSKLLGAKNCWGYSATASYYRQLVPAPVPTTGSWYTLPDPSPPLWTLCRGAAVTAPSGGDDGTGQKPTMWMRP